MKINRFNLGQKDKFAEISWKRAEQNLSLSMEAQLTTKTEKLAFWKPIANQKYGAGSRP